MGFLTQTYLHSETDRVARMISGQLSALDALLTGATVRSLRDQLEAMGDTDAEDNLGTLARNLDNMPRPSNRAAALSRILQFPEMQEYAKGLEALAKQAGYGGLRAACTDKSAVLHPLYAELHRAVFQDNAFTLSNDVTTVFPPTYGVQSFSRVYAGADGSLSDLTTAAGNATTADVSMFGTNGHSVYCGAPDPYSQVVFGLSTKANVTPAYTPSYWNGSAWVAHPSLTDSSAGMTRNDRQKWALPGDWEPCFKDAGGNVFGDLTPLYYTKWTRTASSLGTPPVATCIRYVPQPVLKGSSNHLGVAQPPVGLARISSSGNIAVESIAPVDYTRFREPVVIFRALNVFASSITLLFSYVNQAGANQTQSQSAWTPAALGTVAVDLNGADTGVRSVRETGWTVSGTPSDGVFSIEVAELRSLAL